MTYYDVYIGDLSDPDFKWEDGDPHGNVPKRISPFFPGSSIGAGPFWRLIRLIDNGALQGKQTDWGGWTAAATKEQIEQFVAEHCPSISDELRQFIAGLDPSGTYALVAAEL